MKRPLGIFETAETLTDAYAPLNIVGVIELESGISSDGLRTALDRARRRHPLLRARILQDHSGYFYDFDNVSPIPIEIVDRKDADHWRQIAESELNRAFDPETGPLMRCTLLAGGPGEIASELVVTVLHTIIDGNSAFNLVREILEDWDATAAGRWLEDPEALELLPPVETFFSPAYKGLRAKARIAGFIARQLADEISYRRRARGTRRMPFYKDAECRVLSRTLDGAALDPLVRATRRHRVTLNSALNTALLLVVQRRLYGGDAVPLRNFNFGILRPYLTPPVEDHHLGSFHVMLRSTINLGAEPEFWQLATTVNSQFVANARRGDKYLSLLTIAGVMRYLLGQTKMRMGSTALAYTGPLKLPERIGAINIRGMHAMVSSNVLAPEYAAHARLWRGRLWWDHVYLDNDMDEDTAAAITDEILDLLRRAGKETK